MSQLQFNDGIKFNTDGIYRVERRRDGLYVVGQGVLIPVDSREEGYELIKELKK